MSKQVQHFLYLFGIFYAELINQAGAALLGNYGTGNAAAGIQLLCQLGNALVFGLQNHATVIKILAKAGNRAVEAQSNEVIYIPDCRDELTPLLSVVPLQLFAYDVAKERGCNIDKPKNLAKSVTVE